MGGGQREQVVERMVSLVTRESFSGPMPHPKHLAEYENICPGLADRIMSTVEFAQKRQEDRRDNIIQCEYRDRRLGMILGFSALVLMLLVGVWLATIGEKVIGGGLITASIIGSVVGSFIDGRKSLPKLSSFMGRKKSAESPRSEPESP
jgi:uncharacterized membrane protein